MKIDWGTEKNKAQAIGCLYWTLILFAAALGKALVS